jgi:hypothetical protein
VTSYSFEQAHAQPQEQAQNPAAIPDTGVLVWNDSMLNNPVFVFNDMVFSLLPLVY